MPDVRQYSTLLSCLYDEAAPVGSLGRGTHHSVFRAIEWLDVERRAVDLPQIHDFAVIWDEDHDVRVIEAIERIYMAGLLSPVQFVGERKGFLTLIVAARFYFAMRETEFDAYREAVKAIAQDLPDPWNIEIGSYDRQPGSPHQTRLEGIIADDSHRASLYLGNIDSLWSLGTKSYSPPSEAAAFVPAPFPSVYSAAHAMSATDLGIAARHAPFPPILLGPRK